MIIPTSAVKTTSTITRGFISARKSGSRAAQLDREANCSPATEIAVLFIVVCSAPKVNIRETMLGANFDESPASYPLDAGRIRIIQRGEGYCVGLVVFVSDNIISSTQRPNPLGAGRRAAFLVGGAKLVSERICPRSRGS